MRLPPTFLPFFFNRYLINTYLSPEPCRASGTWSKSQMGLDPLNSPGGEACRTGGPSGSRPAGDPVQGTTSWPGSKGTCSLGSALKVSPFSLLSSAPSR